MESRWRQVARLERNASEGKNAACKCDQRGDIVVGEETRQEGEGEKG